MKETKKTGGGKLTPHQKQVVNSVLYQDLATKLGKSASGGDSRFDSDASESSNQLPPPPPTKRLRSMPTSTIVSGALEHIVTPTQLTTALSELQNRPPATITPVSGALSASLSSAHLLSDSVSETESVIHEGSVDSRDDLFLIYDQDKQVTDDLGSTQASTQKQGKCFSYDSFPTELRLTISFFTSE